MPACKRRRSFTPPPEARPPAPALSFDILLEIVARSDIVTIFRCAASCKPLRCDILSPAFIRRVCHEPGGVVPPCVLGFLKFINKRSDMPRPPLTFSLAHPATPAAASFSEKLLEPLVARNGAASLLSSVAMPIAWSNGLLLLGQGYDERTQRVSMAVYDPLTGILADLLGAPDIDRLHLGGIAYVLLTAADGIGCSFLVLAAEFASRSIKVQILSSSAAAANGGGGAWSPATSVRLCSRSRGSTRKNGCSAVVVGGLIHWLMKSDGFHILTYDVRMATAGTIELPTDDSNMIDFHRDMDLASSPDGRLSLVVADRLVISVWVLSGSTGWERRAVIDAEASLRSAMPEIRTGSLDMVNIARSWSWAKSGAVMLQRPLTYLFYLKDESDEEGVVLVDVETKEMRKVTMKKYALPYEVDLESRLSAMKIF